MNEKENQIIYKGKVYPKDVYYHTNYQCFFGRSKEAILIGCKPINEIDAKYNPFRNKFCWRTKTLKKEISEPKPKKVIKFYNKVKKVKKLYLKKSKPLLVLYHQKYGKVQGTRKEICSKYNIQNSHITGLIKDYLIHTKGFVFNKDNLNRIKFVDKYYQVI